MSTQAPQDAVILRKGDHRLVGVAMLLAGAFAAYMLYVNDASTWKYIFALFLGAIGVYLTFADTRFILFIDEGELVWADHQNKMVTAGAAKIADIARVDVFKVKPFKNMANRPAKHIDIVLTLRDGRKLRLPRNLGFGGPSNPRYEDILTALKTLNPAIKSDFGSAFGEDLKAL